MNRKCNIKVDIVINQSLINTFIPKNNEIAMCQITDSVTGKINLVFKIGDGYNVFSKCADYSPLYENIREFALKSDPNTVSTESGFTTGIEISDDGITPLSQNISAVQISQDNTDDTDDSDAEFVNLIKVRENGRGIEYRKSGKLAGYETVQAISDLADYNVERYDYTHSYLCEKGDMPTQLRLNNVIVTFPIGNFEKDYMRFYSIKVTGSSIWLTINGETLYPKNGVISFEGPLATDISLVCDYVNNPILVDVEIYTTIVTSKNNGLMSGEKLAYIDNHIAKISNPHKVTADQVGALPLSGGKIGYLTIGSRNKDYPIGQYSFAQGRSLLAQGQGAHSEGVGSEAYGKYSHAEGYYTIASGDYQHAEGRYNVDKSDPLIIVGNGTSDSNRHNAIEIERDGAVNSNTKIYVDASELFITKENNTPIIADKFGTTQNYIRDPKLPVNSASKSQFRDYLTGSIGIRDGKTYLVVVKLKFNKFEYSKCAIARLVRIDSTDKFDGAQNFIESYIGTIEIGKTYTLCYVFSNDSNSRWYGADSIGIGFKYSAPYSETNPTIDLDITDFAIYPMSKIDESIAYTSYNTLIYNTLIYVPNDDLFVDGKTNYTYYNYIYGIPGNGATFSGIFENTVSIKDGRVRGLKYNPVFDDEPVSKKYLENRLDKDNVVPYILMQDSVTGNIYKLVIQNGVLRSVLQ